MGSAGNYYDELNVKQDCTAQEIKESFINLSKKYHPDRTTNKNYHAKFVKINNAYSVLSKPSARRLYDFDLVANKDRVYHHYYDNVYSTRPDASFWAGRAGTGRQTHYYGVKGLKKVSNLVIVGLCVIFLSFGVGVEYLALSKSIKVGRERLQEESARNHILWELAREKAVNNGRQQQVQDLQDGHLKGGNVREANEVYARKLLDMQSDLSGK